MNDLLKIGTFISFTYNEKERTGDVVQGYTTPVKGLPYVKVQTGPDEVRSFNVARMSMLGKGYRGMPAKAVR